MTALFPSDGATPDTLLRAADTAMYRVKDEGRSALRFFEPAMDAQLQARRTLGQSVDALTITRTIVNLGHNLGLQVTAEGVETPQQLALVKSLGSDQVPGFLVARPSPEGGFSGLDRLRAKSLFQPELRTVFSQKGLRTP